MAGERKLQAVLQWSINEGSLEKTLKALAPLKKELGEIDKLVAQVSKSLGDLGIKGGGDRSAGVTKIKDALKGVESEANKAAAALDKVDKKSSTRKISTQTAQTKIETPVVSGDLSKSSELSSILAEKTKETAQSTRELASEAFKVYEQTKAAAQEQDALAKRIAQAVYDEQQASKQADSLAQDFKMTDDYVQEVASSAKQVIAEVEKIETGGLAQDFKMAGDETEGLTENLKEAAAAAEQVAQATETIAQATAKAAEAPKKYVSDTIHSSSLFDTKLARVGLTDEQKTQLYEIRKQTPNAYNDAAGAKEYINKVANILTDVQRKQIGIREETEKTASAYQKVAESAKETATEAQKTSEYQPQFEAIPGKKTGGADLGGVMNPLSEMNPQVRDEYLSALTEAEQAALGYRKVLEEVSTSAKKAAASEEELAQAVNTSGESMKNASTKSKGFKDFNKNVSEVTPNLDELNRKLDIAAESSDKVAKAGSRIGAGMKYGIAGFTTQIIGVQIETAIRPLFQLPGKFAEFAGRSNETARAWLNTTARVQNAQMRIAQVVAQVLLPAMEKFARFIDNAAAFAEANPEWVKTLVTGAETLLAAALALKGIGFTLSTIGAAKNLGALIGGGGAVGSALFGGGSALAGGLAAGGAGAILPVVLALLPAVLAAVATYGLKNTSLGGTFGLEGHDPSVSILDEATESLKKLSSTAFGFFVGLGRIIDNLLHFRNPLDGVAEVIADVTQRTYAFAEDLNKASEAIDPSSIIVPDSIVQGISSLLQQLTDLETNYEEERAKIIEDYGQRRADLEQNYEQQRQEIISGYNDQLANLYADYLAQVQQATEAYAKEERRAEEDYYRRRMQAAAEFDKDIERMEEDHQDKLEKMRRDHFFNVEALVASRDALGLAREMRRYEEERAQEEQNYNKEVRRANEDFADKIKQMEEEFAIERARRQEDFEDRLRQLEDNYNRQKQKLAEQEADRLRQLEEQKQKEAEATKDNLEEQLKLLDERYAKEKENIQKQIADQIALAEALGLSAQNIQYIYDTAIEYFGRLQSLRNQVLSSLNFRGYGSGLPTTPTSTGGGNSGSARTTTTYYANGGYVYKEGVYGMAEGNQKEFVLANPTVNALEKKVGGLTQEKLLALTTPRRVEGSAVRVVVDQNNWHIEGALTLSEKRALMGEVRAVTYEAIKNATAR